MPGARAVARATTGAGARSHLLREDDQALGRGELWVAGREYDLGRVRGRRVCDVARVGGDDLLVEHLVGEVSPFRPRHDAVALPQLVEIPKGSPVGCAVPGPDHAAALTRPHLVRLGAQGLVETAPARRVVPRAEGELILLHTLDHDAVDPDGRDLEPEDRVARIR